jgi:type I restriction enzyme S subunit
MTEPTSGDRSELPDGWEWSTLGDLCDKPQYGYTTKAASDGELKFLRTTDIARGPVNWSGVPYCAEPPKTPEKYQLRDGDLVISRSGSVGLSALIKDPPDAVFASYLIRFRPKEKSMARYLRWFMESPLYWGEVRARAAGIGMNNINAKKIAGIPVPCPPAGGVEQVVRRIEAVSGTLSLGLRTLRSADEHIDRYERALLSARLFGRDLPSVGSGLPAGWVMKPLGEVATTSSGGTPSRSRKDFYGGGTPWVKIGDLSDGLVERTDEAVTPEGLANSSASLLPAGTLLLAMYGSIGKLGVLGMDAATNQAICAIHPDPHIILRDWLFWYFRLQRPVLLSAGFGGAQANISQKFLKGVPVPVPPLPDQRAILEELEYSLAVIKPVRTTLGEMTTIADSLRQALLRDAFPGSPQGWDEKVAANSMLQAP